MEPNWTNGSGAGNAFGGGGFPWLVNSGAGAKRSRATAFMSSCSSARVLPKDAQVSSSARPMPASTFTCWVLPVKPVPLAVVVVAVAVAVAVAVVGAVASVVVVTIVAVVVIIVGVTVVVVVVVVVVVNIVVLIIAEVGVDSQICRGFAERHSVEITTRTCFFNGIDDT